MKSEFDARSRAPRTAFACAALLATLIVIASIDLLSRHYGAGAQVAAAAARGVVVAGNYR